MIRTIARTYRAAYSGLPRDLWLVSFVLLVNRAGSMVLPFLSLYLTQERGFTIAAAGRILAIYGLGAIAGSYLGGWLSDRIGSTRTQEVSLIVSGVAYLWFVTLDSLAWIMPGIFVLGVVVEAYRPAAMADIAQRSPTGMQARAFALLRLAANVGIGIGPAVGGFLALYSYRWLFVADAVTCWLAFALLWFTVENVEPTTANGPQTAAEEARSPWTDGPFLLLMSLILLLACALFQFFSTLPVYLREVFGFRESTIGLLMAVNPVLIVMFEMVLIHAVEKRGRMALVGLGSFLLCAGMALMPLGHTLGYILFTIAVWTVGEMLALPLVNAIVADRAGSRSRGRYMGLYSMTFSVAFVFAPAAGTLVYDRLGPEVLWYGIGVLGLVLWAWALTLIRAFGRDRSKRAASSP